MFHCPPNVFRGLAILLMASIAPIHTAALARDIYVDNVAGDDVFDGNVPRSIGPGVGPLRTITRALRAATGGNRIILANTGQPYRESVSLVGSRRSGPSFLPFTIEGNGAILDGTWPVPPDAWQWVADDVFRFEPGRKDFARLFLDGVPAVMHPTGPRSGKVPPLETKEWALVDGWIYFRVEPASLPQQYALSYAALPVGFTLYKVENAVIANVVVQGYALDGINMHDAIGPSRLVGVTCRGNGRSGVAVVGASQVELQACLIGDNGQSQLLVADYSICNLVNCELLDRAGPKWKLSDEARLLLDGSPVR